jgi:hypothetical protein
VSIGGGWPDPSSRARHLPSGGVLDPQRRAAVGLSGGLGSMAGSARSYPWPGYPAPLQRLPRPTANRGENPHQDPCLGPTMVERQRHHLLGGIVILLCSLLEVTGASLGRKFLLGDPRSEVGVRGCHHLLEGFIDAPACSHHAVRRSWPSPFYVSVCFSCDSSLWFVQLVVGVPAVVCLFGCRLWRMLCRHVAAWVDAWPPRRFGLHTQLRSV